MALMAAIIISVILLLIAANLSLTGFYGRFDILDSELKERSSALAEACVDTALLKLANDPNYAGSETITVSGSDTCNIETIFPTADPIVIDTKAIFRDATTKFQVQVNKSDLLVISWEEKI
ncbi:MAG: hypothetical protein UW07_C0021G0006 [Candidatus Nomurabacteria bacterium GW2011_GWF2_43_8]|uniref:Uncharacterized protein n=3 Tax=Candidatus Nomuraibacteriota TaxID=1752729 RepID=A0A0G1HVR9_9BACT|nr:MAG: hypothetical protein UV76_C0008G0029 [Candidatus Nomurabacteria bacterium GW2011_GWA2_43_15]KKT19778.1 MAG: hypothetical protein UW02_C0005G0013 [Candidatus Nomurabacteria bacterium GW2011_GWB1_43_7]KKT23722.1 MAG: hypothetical protein UW07_C0021G0006 [Candidatus Nomurabacteria bacterium GW2011_GWF2_43_8]